MNSEPDLRHAISLRPSPFHPHPYRSDLAVHLDHHHANSQATATSTAIEAGSAENEPPDSVARHHAKAESDVEGQGLRRYTDDDDPFRLASRLKTVEEIERIRPNTSRRRASCTPLLSPADASQAKKIRGFYEAQNENIERLLKPVAEHRRLAKEEHGDNHLQFQIAVQGSFAANVILAALQLYGAISSGSLSLFTTMADALFDPLSNLTLILCNRAVNRVDPRKFPSVSFIIIVMAVRDLAVDSAEETKGFNLPSVIAVAVAFGTKFGLFLYCYALRNKYSQIRILWEDHRNDLLINGFGLLTSVGGSKLRWWIDPMGAIILSCLIVCLWLRTAWSEFQLLIGVSADTNMLQLITYISMTHSPSVRAIDTVRAYHSGPRLIVEVDIVMDPEETLRATHDIAEELQTKLESLPNVERAYVHVDYETSHAPEHFLKKEL